MVELMADGSIVLAPEDGEVYRLALDQWQRELEHRVGPPPRWPDEAKRAHALATTGKAPPRRRRRTT